MAAKQKSDKANAKAPASAPELSEEAKQKIEAELTIEQSDEVADSQKRDSAEDDRPASGDGQTSDDSASSALASDSKKPGRLRRILAGYWRRKKWTLPLTVVALLGLLAGVPVTRYALAAYVVSQPVTVTVTDNTTKKPISSTDVTLEGKAYKTDKDGKVAFKDVKVGNHVLKVSKRYYKDETRQIFVPISEGVDIAVNLVATGRQVPVVVVNKVSGKPLENVTLASVGTEVKTDKEGKAVIVLPADKADLPIKLSNGGFNELEARIKVTDQTVKENTFALTPSGKVYFLSRQSGKIDVVKTDLDGGNRQVVVQGTGKEEDRNTVLLASRDWKYLALLSKRDSGLAKLYLIETATDKMSEMDSGDASFQLSGWSDHDFVYVVNRNKVPVHQANRQAIKSFNADKKQILTLDQSEAGGSPTVYKTQTFGNFILLKDKLVYTTEWSYADATCYGCTSLNDKSNSIRVVSANAANRKDVKSFEAYKTYSLYAIAYEPNEVYISVYYGYPENKNLFFEYEADSGSVKDLKLDGDDLYSLSYPTYLFSPTNKKTAWVEQRDGRQTFFVGDEHGENGKEVAKVDDGQVFGWYGDNYLLLSKKGSELYIMPAEGGTPFKVADYHKPQVTYRGYGGGYGGL